MNRNIWIFDIETLKNCFTYTAINVDTDEIVQFVIWKNRNDLFKLILHLKSIKGMIGFNNLAFDYPVIHYLLTAEDKLMKYPTERVATMIYKKAQDVISEEWSRISNPIIPQLDLFSIHHFNNKARMTNLKKLEIALGFENVQDMPIKHDQDVTDENQINEILNYNLNDVKATKIFYEKSIDKIELRKGIKKEYGIDCLNYSDSKIGEELVLKLYCEHTKQSAGVVKRRRTFRNKFKFIDCIPNYVKFNTEEFNLLLDYLKEIVVDDLKDSFHYEFEYKGLIFHLGTGGIHAACKEGIYESDDKRLIVDCDVSSLYPSLAVVNKIYPLHLGEEFCGIYEGLVTQRLHAKKTGNKVMADGLKLSCNSVYGKSNSEYSFLFDPLYTLKTTLAGQLSLCMLCEMLHINIDNLKILQVNTDGITVIIDKKDKRKYWEICKEWESITNLQLEYVSYEKMIMRDVNNYISLSTDGKIKRKGAFKTHAEMIKDGEWYKAFNQGIVPIALSEYFLNNKSVEDVIRNHNEIYDFCKTFNASHGWRCETVLIDEFNNESNLVNEQKTNRYYVSNNGKVFRKIKEALAPKYNKLLTYESSTDQKIINEIKYKVEELVNGNIQIGVIENSQKAEVTIWCSSDIHKILNKYDKYLNYIFEVSTVNLILSEEFKIDIKKHYRIIEIESENLVTIFNKYEEKKIEEYDINYDFYINECNKIIDTITGAKERREREKKEKREKEKLEREEKNYIKFCVQKIPTSKQFQEYSREWLLEKYGYPSEIKESKLKNNE